ncbi:hypothetical protein COU76_05980 [Candidatus Peregrinibacteria bacterium CG10_big_fil_rev_8_21_14_0_10_49_10]|nr:MAG: hypothetical protein COU76_05980 [Candidatus Peregrinibacteria bacterium CG10_big_fil_rev_8_21_14_0_10_49_10]
MKNPWKQLRAQTSPPFFIREDSATFTKERDENYLQSYLQNHKRELSIRPIPYLGNPLKAKAVLLLLNPGFSTDGMSDIEMQKQHPAFQKRVQQNLEHEHGNSPPFLLLDKQYAYYVGFGWWYERAKELIQRVSWENAQMNLACINYFPYHSRSYSGLPFVLLSQKYSFYLLKQSMKNHALILIWNKSHWYNERNGDIVKNLKEYKNKIEIHARSRHLTKNNLGEKNFSRLCSALSECKCDDPQCNKCLGMNCKDDYCATHTMEAKIQKRTHYGLS